MNNYKELYQEKKPKFEKLKANILSVVKDFVSEKQLPIFDIESRLKEEKSFVEKIARKRYENPFDEIDDICGVRIICYYQEDIEQICTIIRSEFDVLKEENKRNELGDSEFGYTSVHFVITLKPEWLAHPSARGLSGYKAEIQVRTMLMHTWAAISHKLLYKTDDDIPSEFKRKLNRLSALIELADEQFDTIKNEKLLYVDNLSLPNKKFDSSGELNSDSLMAIQKHYFSDRERSDNDIPSLLEELRYYGYSLKSLVGYIESFSSLLPVIEKEEVEIHGDEELPLWNFGGVIRTILELSSDDYFEQNYIEGSAIDENIKKHRERQI